MRAVLLTASVLALAITAGPSSAVTAGAAAASRPSSSLTLPALKPGRARPLVVVVADASGAETTDFVIPYAVLKGSGLADVRSLATTPGALPLMPALTVAVDQSTARFDAETPAGADVVIVPAQMTPKSPALSAWLRGQAAKGATIVLICEGARVLAHAGLLKNRRATTHWFAIDGLERAYRDTTWIRDRRYIQDGPIISTTGVSASIPVSLALVEAIGGPTAARATAARIGVADWDPAHSTADFRLTARDVGHVLASVAAFWRRETLEAPVVDGVDEMALALRADAWERSYRTNVVTTRVGRRAVTGRHGLILLPESEPKLGRHVIASHAGPPAEQLDVALAAMNRRYGPASARLASLGMEYASKP